MRIARIIEYFPPHVGGMERHGLILSEEQIKLGHEVDVFIGCGDEKLLPKIYKMPLQFLPLYSKLRRFWFNFWASRMVVRNHKKSPYDIIHLHGDFVEAYFGGKLSKKLGIPSVLTVHAGLNKKHLRQKNRKFFDDISKIICVSREIADELKIIDVAEEKIEIISSGIYLDEFENVDKNAVIDLRDKYSKPIIISVGVLRINKGFNFLIDAFKKVVDIFPKAMLLIVGDGPERDKLRRLAEDISGIIFLGKTDHNNVVKYLKAADVFVLASVSTEGDREGTSTSIMEAMAAGLPVVATKVGGNSYLIKEERNGLLVAEKDTKSLVETLIRLATNENLCAAMNKNNLEDIKQKDWPIIARKITDVYVE